MRFLGFVKLSIFLLTFIFLAGCGSSDSSLDSTSETSAESASRITSVDRALSLTSDSASSLSVADKASQIVPYFTYVAKAEAPLDPELKERLQATNFEVQDSVAIVTYAMAGNLTRGAIDFVDIKDLKKPRIISTLYFKDSEFADVAVSEKYAYFVGANENGAFLHIRTITPAEKSEAVASLELPGFYATHVQRDGNFLNISSGNNMGILKVDISKIEEPKLVETIELPNALSSIRIGKRFYALGGKGGTSIYGLKNSKASLVEEVSYSELEAPGRIAATNRLLVTNAGQSGLSVFRYGGGDKLKPASHVDLKGTGNGIDLYLSFAFLAQGEAGLMVMNLLSPGAPFYMGRFEFEGEDNGSANQIRICHSFGSLPVAFVADGRGGFKIISIKV